MRMYVRRAESGRVESKESVRRTWLGAAGSAETKRVSGRSWREVGRASATGTWLSGAGRG